MRVIWFIVIGIGLTMMYTVFTSGHVRNVDNAWFWTAVLDHGNIIIDLVILYLGSRVFNHIRTHEVCESEQDSKTNQKTIGPLSVGIMAIWIIAIAIVVSQ